MVPVDPSLFLKITRTGIIITKKGSEFAGTWQIHYTHMPQLVNDVPTTAEYRLPPKVADFVKPMFMQSRSMLC